MRELSAKPRLGTLPGRLADGVQILAISCAFALIAAITFGSFFAHRF